MRRAWVGAAATALVAAVLTFAWMPPDVPVPTGEEEIVIEGVTLVTPGLSRVGGQRLVVRDGRIAEISPARTSSGPGGAAFVLPGLVDMHVHLPPRFAPGLIDLSGTLLLLHGVTAIREVGSIDGSVFEIRDQIAAGERLGPRVFACGPVLDGEPAVWPVAQEVTDPAEADAVVAALAARGASCIKIYDRASPEVRRALGAAARRRGLAVVGHVPDTGPLHDLGLDEVQHLCGPRCGDLFEREQGAWIREAAEQGVGHTPTLVVFEGQALLYEGTARLEALPYRLVPRFWRETFWRPELAVALEPAPVGHETALAEQRRSVLGSMQRLVRRLHAAGVRIHAGSDPIQPFVVPGASLHRELALLHEAGLAIEDALAAATWVAGESLGLPRLGRLEVGAPADLLLLRKDPTRDLTRLDSLEAVIADGRLYDVDTLRTELARETAYFERMAVDVPLRAVGRAALSIARRAHEEARLR